MDINELSLIQIGIVQALSTITDDRLLNDQVIKKRISLKKSGVSLKDKYLRIYDIEKALEYIQTNNLAFFSLKFNPKTNLIDLKKVESNPEPLTFQDRKQRQAFEKTQKTIKSDLFVAAKKSKIRKHVDTDKISNADWLMEQGLTHSYGPIIHLDVTNSNK